jgi:2-polyprenyl-6-methoxyphenol hydroxylase-like FAD-dependent oxidoreductase
VRRFAGHRATQLVAVGLLGLVLGGGIVGAVAANRFDQRPGHVRMYDRGDRGPDRGGNQFDQRGPFHDRGDRFER